MNKLRILFPALILQVIFNAAAIGEDFSKEIIHTWQGDSFENITVEADFGDIEVNPSLDGLVRLTVRISANTSNAAKAEKAFEMITVDIIEQDSLQIDISKGSSTFSWLFFWRANPSVQVNLWVPEGQKIGLAAGSGDIQVSDVSGPISSATGSGDMRIANSSGSFEGATGSGDIDLVDFKGKVSAATGSGDVIAAGDISSFNIATGAGDVDVRLKSDINAKSSIATGAGDITVLFKPDAKFTLNADVGFGSIQCDVPLQNRVDDKGSLTGQTSENAPDVHLNTGFGKIRVSYY